MRYMGIPLIPGKLSAQDEKTFRDKITSGINSWNSRSLSFAGRLQLLPSVLYTIEVY